jgi:1-acyl-sn-glycerol-3-phosphate acyltransferase
MRKISTAWMYFVVTLTLPVGYAVALVIHVLGRPFDPYANATHFWVSSWCFQYLRSWPGWRARVIGAHLLPKGPCVLVANHQSMADILALMGLPTNFKFVSKGALFRIPLLGFIMKLMRYVPLERGRHSSMTAMMDRCAALLRAQQKILVFPEGTYAPRGYRLAFKRGAFKLALDHQVPVVPIVLTGTRQLIDEDGPTFGPRADISIEVKAPILFEGRDEDLTALIQEKYLAWLGEALQPEPNESRR